jgi:hypothetical protein
LAFPENVTAETGVGLQLPVVPVILTGPVTVSPMNNPAVTFPLNNSVVAVGIVTVTFAVDVLPVFHLIVKDPDGLVPAVHDKLGDFTAPFTVPDVTPPPAHPLSVALMVMVVGFGVALNGGTIFPEPAKLVQLVWVAAGVAPATPAPIPASMRLPATKTAKSRRAIELSLLLA